MKSSVERQQEADRKTLGFWIYLMTDCVLFASLFATYVVYRNATFGGPDAKELFDLEFILVETMILLTSSFTVGLALIAAHAKQRTRSLVWLGVTFMLGVAFLSMEIYEFAKLIHEGASWTTSAFLSAYFTLVGTHGLHILVGLIWLVVIAIKIANSGLREKTLEKLGLFSLFWHFLDIIWIFIFSIVYLMGVAT